MRGAVALTAMLLLAGCGAPSVSAPGSTAASASPSDESALLPAGGALIPDGVAGATDWRPMQSQPGEFDAGVAHPTPGALAEAFATAIHASWADSPDRPELALDVVEESNDRAMLVLSETGMGDDSVAGTQYVVVARVDDDGWRLDELWTRALCRRGVSDQLCV